MVKSTEARNPRSADLDCLDAAAIVALMNTEEQAALQAVVAATEKIAQAATKLAEVYQAGGRVVFLGAGTSGRLAVMDTEELAPTFGIPTGRFVTFTASGESGGPTVVTADEDDTETVIQSLRELGVGREVAVVGVASSGTTPFVVESVRYAHWRGAWTCGITNNPRTPLLDACALGILLDIGPEVVTGSRRLKARTAQKLALNRLSTTTMVLCGKVNPHDLMTWDAER